MHYIACTNYNLADTEAQYTQSNRLHIFFPSQIPLVAASFLISALVDNNVCVRHSFAGSWRPAGRRERLKQHDTNREWPTSSSMELWMVVAIGWWMCAFQLAAACSNHHPLADDDLVIELSF